MPPSSEELRQRALARSSQRGAGVARRRLWWRWFLWGLWRALALLALAAALVWGLVLAWRAWSEAPRSLIHPRPASPQAASDLPLRLDDSDLPRPASGPAQPASAVEGPAAQSAEPASTPTSESPR